jgi:AraC-like DNA-binding protein
LRSWLSKQKCSADDVAALFGINRRTLNRYLRVEGTDFRSLADDVRFDTARRLLMATRLPLGQIAADLHFSSASAFTRAFHRWSGRAPSDWRADNGRH